MGSKNLKDFASEIRDLDKIILSHGHVILQDGKEVFRQAFERVR